MPPRPDLRDPSLVAREYADEGRLAARRRAWAEFRVGPSVDDGAFDAVAEGDPRRVLDVGCGWGDLAARIVTELGASVIAVDASARMAELAGERGLPVCVADIHDLPFPDGAFDTIVANAVLYHLRDLDRGLREVGRLLGTGGRFVATTFGTDRFSELWSLIGSSPPPLPFDVASGEVILRGRFAEVEVRSGEHALVFPSVEEVRDYMASTIAMAAQVGRVPDIEGPFRTTRTFAVFVASRPVRA